MAFEKLNQLQFLINITPKRAQRASVGVSLSVREEKIPSLSNTCSIGAQAQTQIHVVFWERGKKISSLSNSHPHCL